MRVETMLKPIGPTFALVLAACNPEAPTIIHASNVALDEPGPGVDPACPEGQRPVAERDELGPTVRYCVNP